MSFPSDQLTIGTLRKIYPPLFDTVPDGKSHQHQPIFFRDADGPLNAGQILGNMLWIERFLVYAAYADVKKLPIDELDFFRLADFREELSGLYVDVGIAQGRKHAMELINGIEQMTKEDTNQIQQ